MRVFLKNLETNPPATDSQIADCEKWLGAKLPTQYVEFLKLSNGGEGFVGENQPLILWQVERLASINQAYHVADYANGLVIFGSNGGGDAYGFDMRSPEWSIVAMPFVGMDWSLAMHVGTSSFEVFLRSLKES